MCEVKNIVVKLYSNLCGFNTVKSWNVVQKNEKIVRDKKPKFQYWTYSKKKKMYVELQEKLKKLVCNVLITNELLDIFEMMIKIF